LIFSSKVLNLFVRSFVRSFVRWSGETKKGMGRIEGRSLRRDLAQQKHTHTHRKMAINFPFVRAVVNLVVLLVFRRRLLFLFWNFISLFLLVFPCACCADKDRRRGFDA
jgi:fatty-acid desaturase